MNALAAKEYRRERRPGLTAVARFGGPQGARDPWSAALLGWGAFNVLDSGVNHYGLRFHDVVERSANPWIWNLAFLIFGIVQLGVGAWIIRRDLRSARPS
jgi:uncharacterized membrane protein